MKRGILGGTFDPVHNGHLMIAGETLRQLDLDEVVFIPAAVSPFKQQVQITPVFHRLRMLELALHASPGFSISTIEVDRAGISYTVETLQTLLEAPHGSDELFLILGLDSLDTFARWKDAVRIVKLCRLVSLRRPGYKLPDIANLEKKLPGLSDRLTILEAPLMDISSTGIRAKAAQGISIADMVPAAVAAYIVEHGLYVGGK